VPELPEVESARIVIERAALGRVIVGVDDSDTYVCRPHPPGAIRLALLGRCLTAAHRRGKSMWCDTSVTEGAVTEGPASEGPASVAGPTGPALGLHLGMSGKIVIADEDGAEIDGGDYWERGRAQGDYRHTRFSLSFADGGRMMLIDPRRLGRVRLDPPVEALGPDALTITPDAFRAALAGGSAPVKARLLDQDALAGIGNLLADEALWLARIGPSRSVADLSADDVDELYRAVRCALSAAVADGGVHTLSIVEFRRAGARCPRDGAAMERGTVGGRTTWWCSREQT
jgi:formamidopyrimidine-DNA glycosylase